MIKVVKSLQGKLNVRKWFMEQKKHVYLPFSVWLGGWTRAPLFQGFVLSPPYAPIRCCLEVLSTRSLLLHLGRKRTSASAKMINPNTHEIVIQTTLLVFVFDFSELDFLDAVGPLACLGGTRPKNGVPGTTVPDGEAVIGEWGGRAGAIVALPSSGVNWFPSLLHIKYHNELLSYWSTKVIDKYWYMSLKFLMRYKKTNRK